MGGWTARRWLRAPAFRTHDGIAIQILFNHQSISAPILDLTPFLLTKFTYPTTSRNPIGSPKLI